jgi:hypothetical protein
VVHTAELDSRLTGSVSGAVTLMWHFPGQPSATEFQSDGKRYIAERLWLIRWVVGSFIIRLIYREHLPGLSIGYLGCPMASLRAGSMSFYHPLPEPAP